MPKDKANPQAILRLQGLAVLRRLSLETGPVTIYATLVAGLGLTALQTMLADMIMQPNEPAPVWPHKSDTLALRYLAE